MMEKRKKIFNFFDIVIIAVVLVVAALFLMWKAGMLTGGGSGSADSAKSGTVEYTIRLNKLDENTAAMIQEGDALLDTIKNREMGTVVSVETAPYEETVKNTASEGYTVSEFPGLFSADIVVQVPCSETDSAITAQSGFEVRGQTEIHVSGPGYYGEGYVISVERGDAQ